MSLKPIAAMVWEGAQRRAGVIPLGQLNHEIGKEFTRQAMRHIRVNGACVPVVEETPENGRLVVAGNDGDIRREVLLLKEMVTNGMVDEDDAFSSLVGRYPGRARHLQKLWSMPLSDLYAFTRRRNV